MFSTEMCVAGGRGAVGNPFQKTNKQTNKKQNKKRLRLWLNKTPDINMIFSLRSEIVGQV